MPAFGAFCFFFALVALLSSLILHRLELTKNYPALGLIDKQWKDKIEPTRVLANQILRLFSGKMLQTFIGARALVIKPTIIQLGNSVNLLNALLNLWLAVDNKPKESKSKEKPRPLYTFLVYFVMCLCLYSISMGLFGLGGLTIFNAPISLIGGAVTYGAEIISQFRLGRDYYAALYHYRKFYPQEGEEETAIRKQEQNILQKKSALKRRQYSNFISLITTYISWFPILAPTSILVLIGEAGLRNMGLMGLTIAIGNFAFSQTKTCKDRLLINLNPDENPDAYKLEIGKIENDMVDFLPQSVLSNSENSQPETKNNNALASQEDFVPLKNFSKISLTIAFTR